MNLYKNALKPHLILYTITDEERFTKNSNIESALKLQQFLSTETISIGE